MKDSGVNVFLEAFVEKSGNQFIKRKKY